MWAARLTPRQLLTNFSTPQHPENHWRPSLAAQSDNFSFGKKNQRYSTASGFSLVEAGIEFIELPEPSLGNNGLVEGPQTWFNLPHSGPGNTGLVWRRPLRDQLNPQKFRSRETRSRKIMSLITGLTQARGPPTQNVLAELLDFYGFG
jgi:hypothetical protein